MIDLTNITFKNVVEATNDIVIVTDAALTPPGPRILYVNPAFTRLTGYTPEDAIGQSPRMLQGPSTSRVTLAKIRQNLQAGLDVRETVLNFGKFGTRYWLDLSITPLRNPAGVIVAFIAIQRDVTLNRHQVDIAGRTTERDILTGIPNLLGLSSAIESNMLSKTAPNALPCHLASFEIEHFEQIAAEYGDATAEALLIGVADRLADNIRRIDSIGRIGRNTFGICMASISLANATIMCDRLRNCIAEEPFATPSGRMNITVGISISAIDTDSQSASDIIARAGNTRHTAHKSGRRRIGIEQLRIRP